MTNVLTVRPGQEMFGGVDRGDARLTAKDARVAGARPAGHPAVSPEMQRRLQVEHGRRTAIFQVFGVWPSYLEIQNHALAAGRLFTDAEERGRRRVAVLGAGRRAAAQARPSRP